MCGCSGRSTEINSAVHNNAVLAYCFCLYTDLTYRNSGRRLLILSDGKAAGECTTFQAGEPELQKSGAAEKCLGEKRPGPVKNIYGGATTNGSYRRCRFTKRKTC